MSELKRLVLNFRTDEFVVRCLYRTEGEVGTNTKARWRDVADLTREGLCTALEGLERRVDGVGTSGFTTREDIVLCTTKGDAPWDEHKTVKKGA